MQPSDWVAAAIAGGALVVAIIAVVFSAQSAGAARAAANAAEASALVAKRQLDHELAREGIVDFGPWRAEAFFQSGRHWRFVNIGDRVLHDLAVDAYDSDWHVVDGEEVKPGWTAIVAYPVGHEYAFPLQVEVRWREGAATPRATALVRLHHPRQP